MFDLLFCLSLDSTTAAHLLYPYDIRSLLQKVYCHADHGSEDGSDHHAEDGSEDGSEDESGNIGEALGFMINNMMLVIQVSWDQRTDACIVGKPKVRVT